jgi:hypothetical protein
MQFDIPEEVAETFGSIWAQTLFSETLKLLGWISKHPEEAKKVASQYKMLKRSEEDVFRINMFRDADLEKTLEWTKTFSAREHKHRSLVAKFLAELRKGKATIKFGTREGAAVRIQDDLQLTIPTGDTEVVFICCDRHPLHVLQTLADGDIPTYSVSYAIYQGRRHLINSNSGKSLVKAVENNLRPEIVALIGT